MGLLTLKVRKTKFVLNEKDVPIEVYFKPVLDTNHMIEEFMLLANKTIATLVGKPKNKSRSRPFVYRIHDVPLSEKISSLGRLVKKLGYNLDSSSKTNLVYSLNNLHKHIKGRKEQDMLEKLIIRSMAKAVYSTNNIGHYGLGFDYYTHFTSPIRRYPDLIVHRLLEQYLAGKSFVSADDLEAVCKYCSEMEKRAAVAERDSIKYMQVKYMRSNVGKTFSGIISGVTDWGLYVELSENKCEGLIKIKSLKEDYFIHEEEKFALVGAETKVQYQLGQNVRIKVMAADLDKRQLSFIIV